MINQANLTNEQKREIRQLWFVAEHYFQEATKLTKIFSSNLNQTGKEIERFFELNIPNDEIKCGLTLLSAHLASAAVRLCTIEDRLQTGLIDSVEGVCGKDMESIRAQYKRGIEKYLPYLLRHNIGHIEDGESNAPYKQDRWKARKIVLESESLISVYSVMDSIFQDFKKHLISQKTIIE